MKNKKLWGTIFLTFVIIATVFTHYSHKKHIDYISKSCENYFLEDKILDELINNYKSEVGDGYVSLKQKNPAKYNVPNFPNNCSAWLEFPGDKLDLNNKGNNGFLVEVAKDYEYLEEFSQDNFEENSPYEKFEAKGDLYIYTYRLKNGTYVYTLATKQYLELLVNGQYTDDALTEEEAREMMISLRNDVLVDENLEKIYSHWTYIFPWY